MKSIIFTLILSFFAHTLLAQSAIVAAGGDAIGAEGSVSYSLGQLVYTTIVSEGGTGTVAQGVQQPYTIEVTTGFSEANIQLAASVYPNPAKDLIQLTIENKDLHKLSYQLFDMQGKRIVQNGISRAKTPISLSELAAGSYLITVSDGQDALKTFKILKAR